MNRFRKIWLWIRPALLTLGMILLTVTLFPPRWYALRLAGPWSDPRGPTLIVLGAESLGDGTIGLSSYWRTVYAVRAWREGGFEHIIVSAERPTSDPMRDFMVANGVPAAAITVEGRSTSTHENALFTADLARNFPAPYVLLTSDYHMWRASRAFRHAGLPVEPRPVPDIIKRFNSWRDRWAGFQELCLESLKIVYYKVAGWI